MLLRRYPPTVELHDQVDEKTAAQHCKLMKMEATKTKLRIHQIILPLMKITYATRSLFIRTQASSVQEIVETYTALKLPSVVSVHIKALAYIDIALQMEQEMNLIFSTENTKDRFVNAWRKYVPTIISYARKAIKSPLSDIYSLLVALQLVSYYQ